MKKGLFLFILAVLAVSYFTNPLSAKEPSRALEFTLGSLNGDKVTLSEFKNKSNVLLFFWTTWCPFCRAELKELSKNYETLTKDGVTLICVDVGESPDKVRNLAQKLNLGFRVFLDFDGSVADSYEVMGVPTYVLIDKNSEIVFVDNSFPKKYKEMTFQK